MSENKKKGCFFWGCLTVIVLVIIVIVVGFIVFNKIKDTALQYTSETPIEITAVEYTKEEAEEVNKKVKSFVADVKEGKSAVEGVFSDRDLNIYMDSKKDLKGKAKLNFDDNKIKGSLSVPITGVPIIDGRYLAGDVEFKVTCDDGNLDIRMESWDVNGKKVPDDVLNTFKNQNLADHLYKNPKLAPLVRRIKNIKMKDNKLYIEVDPEKM